MQVSLAGVSKTGPKLLALMSKLPAVEQRNFAGGKKA